MKKIFKTLALAVAGALFMAACDDVPSPYKPGGDDKKDTTLVEVQEITCAQAIELCSALEDNATSTETYAITGYITDVYATVSNNQQSFWMADAQDGGKQVQAFWANLPEGVAKFATGSKVKITGKLLKYVKSGTTDVVTEVKNATVEILEAGGSVEAEEVTCAKAAELCNALEDGATSEQTYAVTGYITDVFATVSNGQQSFWMADTKDGGKVLQAYWANLPEGVEKFTAGSKVKITGKLLKYVKSGSTDVVVEVKNADVQILEQGDTPEPPAGDAVKVTCAQAVEACSALADGATSEQAYAVTGYITKLIGSVSRNQQSFWMADTKDGGEVFEAYWANLPEGVTAFTEGSKVTITGQIIKYMDKDGNMVPEIKNATVVILEAGGDQPGGGEQPGSDADVSMLMSSAYSECTTGSVDATPVTVDGVTVSFDKNGGNNAPKYYWNQTASFCAVRMYAKNTMTVKADKSIAKVVLTCAAPGGGKNYNGNDEMTTSAGSITKASDNVTVTIDAINSTEVTVTNDFTATSGGTQLRVVNLEVFYAK